VLGWCYQWRSTRDDDEKRRDGQMAARMRVPHLSVDERRAKGKEARVRTPPSSHAG
jgi:hypothetical protein